MPRSMYARPPGRFRRFVRGGLFVLAALAVALPAFADGPILHEYVPYDPATDSDLGAVTIEGGFAAELQTRSGKVTAPDAGRPITPKTPLYTTKPAVPDEAYNPDRDTRRVDNLPYDDPFRPSLSPFKRLVALDAVDSDYKLKLRSKKHKTIDIAKEEMPKEPVDPFYVDLALELRAGEPIRIPNAIGGTAVKKAHIAPPVGFHLERDEAENLFIVAEGGGSARLVLELAAPRDAFAGETSVLDWSDMKSDLMPTLPSNVQKAADTIAKELGIDKSTMRPNEAIRKMVAYFRDFKESEDPPPTTSDIYLDIARAKKGVCRHRAFAMMITALGLGIPARFVHNEAHAWVEVHDGYLWRRVDLGGAGRVLDDKTEKPDKPQPHHDPPPDPYAWPAGATKGSDLVPPSRTPGPSSTGTTPSPSTPPTPTGSSTPPSTAPPSKVTLVIPASTTSDPFEVNRSKTLSVKGKILASDGSNCKIVRVEILLKSSKGVEKIAGVLTTDADGNYDGKVTIPTDIPLDDYTVVAHTPGDKICGQGNSE